jgi:hypothetical protein
LSACAKKLHGEHEKSVYRSCRCRQRSLIEHRGLSLDTDRVDIVSRARTGDEANARGDDDDDRDEHRSTDSIDSVYRSSIAGADVPRRFRIDDPESAATRLDPRATHSP